MSDEPRSTRGRRRVRRAEAREAALEAEVQVLRAALTEIVAWCDEGGEPVCAWPAERARAALSGGEPTNG